MLRSMTTAGSILLLAAGTLLAQATPGDAPVEKDKAAAPAAAAPEAKPAPQTPPASKAAPTTQPDVAIPAAAIKAEQRQALDKALKQLVEEAKSIDNFEEQAPRLYFSRPHPAVATWGPDMAVPCLERMMQNFTSGPGADYRDSYIRWHLMWVVKKASQDDRERTGPRLVKLIRNLPTELAATGRQEHRYEPPDVWQKYVGLVHSGDVVIGYPPFQKVLHAPASYPYLPPDKVAQVKKNLEEANLLKDKFKVITDQKAIAFNARVRELNYIVRQYRGELIYALLLTGDPEMARLVMSEIDKLAAKKSGTAFDLLAFVYLAAFDGALNLYEQKVLDEMSSKLESSARRMEGYMDYSGTKRNFADYAFHMIYMLRDGGGFIDAKEAERLRASR